MNVISLTEPYATLIKNGIKNIETRSWKTNYRGKLYIHASSTKISKKDKENKELMSLVKDALFDFGRIICECELTDCIYMTEDYIQNIKKNHYQEYLCGIYEVGRYAWVLKNIKPLSRPIIAKGNLNIWHYYNELEIMEKMNEIHYGWVDKDHNLHDEVDKNFSTQYILQSPKEVLQNKIGVCWDQVELERYYFKNNDWKIKTFFLVHYDEDKCPTHTFLTFEKNNKVYWFEHSWEIFRGIHEYNDLKTLLFDIRDKFIQYELNHKYNKQNLVLYEYKKPKYHIEVQEFYRHCENGICINFDEL